MCCAKYSLAAELSLPNVSIIQDLPSLWFVHDCHGDLLDITKTLLSFKIVTTNSYGQLFSDGTPNVKHQSKNVSVRVVSDGGFKTLTFSKSIIAEDETA